MTIRQIRAGLAASLAAVDLAAVYATVPDRIVSPSVAIIPGDPFAEYHEAMGGDGAGALTVYRFDVILFAGRWEPHAGQEALDDLADVIPAALEADPTLGGVCKVVRVDEATNYGGVTVADSTYLGCRFSVEVYQ